MLTLLAARSMGFKNIVITDVAEYNLKTALANGADRAVNVAQESLGDAISEVFGGKKADAVFVTASAPNILEQALENVKILGTIIYLSMIIKPLTFNTFPIVFKKINFIGSLNYTKKDFQMALDMLAATPEEYAKLITHCFDFSNCQKAFEMIHNRSEGFVKVLLKV